jgi:hypothetical protein
LSQVLSSLWQAPPPYYSIYPYTSFASSEISSLVFHYLQAARNYLRHTEICFCILCKRERITETPQAFVFFYRERRKDGIERGRESEIMVSLIENSEF